MRWKAVDLFAGCGGLTEGLSRAGFSVVSGVEIDSLAANTYRMNHPSVKLFEKDIREVDGEELLSNGRGTIDLVAGCPPCQGFSRVRRRNRARQARDPRNRLVDEFARVVREVLPSAVFVENVPGIENYARFRELLDELESLDYRVNEGVLDLAEYGVPQRRRRVLVLAGKGFSIPFPKKARYSPNVRSTIGSLPLPKRSRVKLHRITTKHAPEVIALIEAVPKNGGSRRELPDHFELDCHKRCDGFKDIYGRMSWNEPSPTITSGCINASKGRFIHPSQNRVITLYEAALLQTFPRSYRFDDARGRYGISEMIGNALPPEFARRVGRAIIDALERRTDG